MNLWISVCLETPKSSLKSTLVSHLLRMLPLLPILTPHLVLFPVHILRATPYNFSCRLWPTYYVPGPEITALLGDLSAEVHREQVTCPGHSARRRHGWNSNPDCLTSHLGLISLDSSMIQRSQRLLEYGQRPREGVSIFWLESFLCISSVLTVCTCLCAHVWLCMLQRENVFINYFSDSKNR